VAKAKRVCFLSIAQHHEVLHSLSVAVAMLKGRPGIQVEVAAASPEPLADVSTPPSEPAVFSKLWQAA
jgi:hypothetical protein